MSKHDFQPSDLKKDQSAYCFCPTHKGSRVVTGKVFVDHKGSLFKAYYCEACVKNIRRKNK